MKHLFTFFFLLPLLGFSQENYVANVANSATPSMRNTLVGPEAGINITTARYNTFIGSGTGYGTTSGEANTFIGTSAGYKNTIGGSNTFIGFQAGSYNTQGFQNTFLGNAAGFSNTLGVSNICMGYQAGLFNTWGRNNSFLGTFAGFSNTLGIDNTFIGFNSGYLNTTGESNVCLGTNAGYNNSTGNNNVFIGPLSGTAVQTGDNNVMLGANAQPTSGSLRNTVAIGANAQVALNNAIVLGDPTNTSIAVGIGTDSPMYPLDVKGIINIRGNGKLKFTSLTNPSLRNGTTDQFLTVNEQGETVLATYRLRIDQANQWSDKVFSLGYSLKPLSQVEQHIHQHGHLPNVPSAEQVVREGVDLVKMNALLLEKVEELTLYTIQLEKADKSHQAQLEKSNKEQQAQIDELKRLVEKMLEKRSKE